jgi:hypothetical protein
MSQVLNAVPSVPQHSGEQMAQFRYAEPHLRGESFSSACSQHGSYSMCQHGQRDMPIPALPVGLPDVLYQCDCSSSVAREL